MKAVLTIALLALALAGTALADACTTTTTQTSSGGTTSGTSSSATTSTTVTSCESKYAGVISDCEDRLKSCLEEQYSTSVGKKKRSSETTTTSDEWTSSCPCADDYLVDDSSSTGRRRSSETTASSDSDNCSTCNCACFYEYFDCYTEWCDNMTAAIYSVPEDYAPYYTPQICSDTKPDCYFVFYGDPHVVKIDQTTEGRSGSWTCQADGNFPNLYESDYIRVSANATLPPGLAQTYTRSVTIDMVLAGKTVKVTSTHFNITNETAPEGYVYRNCNKSVNVQNFLYTYPCVAVYAPSGEFVYMFLHTEEASHLGPYIDVGIYGYCDGNGTVQNISSCPGTTPETSLTRREIDALVTPEEREARAKRADISCSGLALPFSTTCKTDVSNGGSAQSAALASKTTAQAVNFMNAYAAIEGTSAAVAVAAAGLTAGAVAGITIGLSVAVGAASFAGGALVANKFLKSSDEPKTEAAEPTIAPQLRPYVAPNAPSGSDGIDPLAKRTEMVSITHRAAAPINN